ncbi:MAG TPA: hypothetical protein VMU51_00965 [Mycobacteriales bacterium]|nr:hypothetical protein [Mycobacteriales bacterium]
MVGTAAVLWAMLAAGAPVDLLTDTELPGMAVGGLLVGAAVVVTERAWRSPRPTPAPAPWPDRGDELATRAFYLARRMSQEYQGGHSHRSTLESRPSA